GKSHTNYTKIANLPSGQVHYFHYTISQVVKWTFFFSCYDDHPDLHSFPTRRSSDLFLPGAFYAILVSAYAIASLGPRSTTAPPGDRKSTRLNSSHRTISYAVLCLKKKSASESRCRSGGRRQRSANRLSQLV